MKNEAPDLKRIDLILIRNYILARAWKFGIKKKEKNAFKTTFMSVSVFSQ